MDLVSKVERTNEPIEPDQQPEAKARAPEPTRQRKPDTASPETQWAAQSPHASDKSPRDGKSDRSSAGKWILGIIGVALVIWMINHGQQNDTGPYRSPPSSSQNPRDMYKSPAPAAQTPSPTRGTTSQYEKPNVGTNNVLALAEIRWCIRQQIRIKAMRSVLKTNDGVDAFNRIVGDYNSRCASYRYRQGSQAQAEHDVEPRRSQIVSEAIRAGRKLDGSYQSPYPSAAAGSSTGSASKPNAQITRETQRLLTTLGYDAGPVDGQYGPKTAAAVRAFQRDRGLSQDGRIDQLLLLRLRLTDNSRQ